MPSAKQTFNELFNSFLDDDFFGPAAKTITFDFDSAGSVDPITGEITGGNSEFYSADGFIRDPHEGEFADIVGGDLVFTVKQDDLGYTPNQQDECVIVGGESLTFNGTYKVNDLHADGAGVTYRIQLRR